MNTDIKIEIINQLSDNYTYIIYSSKTKKALVVDPAESKHIIDYIINNNLSLESVLITHHHSDHTSGIQDLLNFKNVNVFSPNSKIQGTSKLIKDKDCLYFEFITFEVIATPGREVNKVLIGVVKQLKSMRNTYRRFHKYEIPVGNPIETELKKISVNLGALAKLSGNSIKDSRYDSSREAGNKYKSRLIERAKMDRRSLV